MWSGLIKVHYIRLEQTVELLLMEDQEVIKAFSPHAQEKAFTSGIRSWGLRRRSKHLDATCCCYACNMLPECAIIIPDQLFGRLPIWSRLPQR